MPSLKLMPILVSSLIALGGHGASARGFDLGRDTFEFANETVFQYGVDERGKLNISRRERTPRYAHRCFVMSRAVIQFHQFARFAPERPQVSREQYANLVRKISAIPVWSGGPHDRVAVPGFRDLRQFSEVMPGVLQENLGAWFPSYVRVGNYRMAMGHPRSGQAAAARWLEQSMTAGKPRALYLSRFPHMNHCVVAYRMERKAGGDLRFWVYDPNYPGKAAWLDYSGARRSFDFEPRWYFPGGQVNVMRVYISPFH
ncbi:MAG TPA: hypothetical protein VFG14_03720 [Chthoniobacteraceae bacterium]|jgi:hypothetical protein|nr:hypothetical protein [Chthoniobacteraceae bacterium]